MNSDRLKLISTFLLVACLVIVTLFIVPLVSETVEQNSELTQETMQQAIDRALVHCYAIEGEYPTSLEYLSEYYGIVLQEERFYYYYEYLGSNIRPTVKVLEK